MLKVKIYYSNEDSLSRILTGFYLLEKAGVVLIESCEKCDATRNKIHSEILEVEIEGKLYAFDMTDNGRIPYEAGKKYLSRVEAYFMRSYSAELHKQFEKELQDKIRPFGFNYYTTYAENPINIIQNPSMKEKIKELAKHISGYNKAMYVDYFEGKANYVEKNPKIIFMTRLWDPGEISLKGDMSSEVKDYRIYMIEERKKINSDRTTLVRELKKIYGDNFVGGIQYSTFAEKYSPDILIPTSLTRKKAYLSQMKRSDICIGSMGLHRSTGWKTGEYIAAARAIVVERMWYDVPGNFVFGDNYLQYDSVEEALIAVEKLYTNPEYLYSMKKANELYYREYLRPEKQICNALEQFITFE